ncbi:MAG: hypothetical protein H0T62_02090 [Parachlamydiaceae bacterium]|nr:hypothetical protein [Parachlamydiaceae bacterium]
MFDTIVQPTSSMMDFFYSNCTRVAEKWSKPEGEQFTRISLVGVSLLSLANTVTQVFFSICTLIPGSSSEWVKNKIDIEVWARDGFDSPKDIGKGRVYSAQLILPTLFKAIALTLNPYATIKQPKFGELEKVKCYSYFLFEKADACAKKGMSKEDLYESTGDIRELDGFTEYTKNSDDDDEDEISFNEDNFISTQLNFKLEEISPAKMIEQKEATEVGEIFPAFMSGQEEATEIEQIPSTDMIEQEQATEVDETKAEWKKWVIEEIGTRALYFMATLTIVVEKTIYIAAGILFAACSLGLGFKYTEVNLLAMEYLGALDVIDDVRSGLLAMVSPDKSLTEHHQRILDTPRKVKFS